MTIKRTINGVEMEFELTKQEMWYAYCEEEHEFDKQDVRSTLVDIDDDRIPPALTEEQINDVACLAREWMNENDNMAETRWEIIHDAILEAIKE